MNWRFELIVVELTAMQHADLAAADVNLPPRHLKSHLASVAFPAWCLGYRLSARILCVSYAQDLADKLSRDCPRIVASDWYRRLFPTRLSPQRQAATEFETTAQGCRLATSVGGVLTGRGADIIIIDDPLKPEEALSEAHRRADNEWFDHTLQPPQPQGEGGDHPNHAPAEREPALGRDPRDDLVGHVLVQEDRDIVRFPAIAEADETHVIDTLAGPRVFTRRQGEPLHAARESLPMLEQIRRTIGENNFAGQYQQMPAPLGGGMIKAAWFRQYTPDELPATFERIVQSWDTARRASSVTSVSARAGGS
jgi:hypothetical protein